MTDPFSQHEALDRAHLLADAFQRHLADHAFIRAHPDLAARCDLIADALGELYQAIGAVEDAGSECIPENGGGAGVRLRKNLPQ